jgi:hypothetical protein
MSEPGDGECLWVTGEEVSVRMEEDKHRVVIEKGG